MSECEFEKSGKPCECGMGVDPASGSDQTVVVYLCTKCWWSGAGLANHRSMLRFAASDLCFNRIQRADTLKRFGGNRRAVRFMDVEEPSTRMRLLRRST